MKNAYFESHFTYNPKREIVWQEVAKYLERYIPKDGAFLELAAGYCHFVNNVKARERHALDLFEEIGKYAAKDVVVHKQSACDLRNFKSETFDVVFASNFLEHLEINECDQILGEVRRILKCGGRLIIIQPNFRFSFRNYFDDYTHKRIFTDVSLAECLRAQDFEIELVNPKFLPFSLKSRLPKIGLLIRLYLHFPVKPFGKQMLVIAKKRIHKGI
ncbi:MAG: class I SAM-dependent methyltransferase [Candidatus Omnitrophica bacterium]|nr:class I SAM-dependent methyltransferase [Candidatus Omnitrophota bacterium]